MFTDFFDKHYWNNPRFPRFLYSQEGIEYAN